MIKKGRPKITPYGRCMACGEKKELCDCVLWKFFWGATILVSNDWNDYQEKEKAIIKAEREKIYSRRNKRDN